MKIVCSCVFLFFYFQVLYNVVYSEENVRENDVPVFHTKTLIKNPMELRDPFKRKINKKKASLVAQKTFETGIYTNEKSRIEEKPIENIRIVGIVIGKERRAMAKIAEGATLGTEVFFIKEGMLLGPNGAEVKAILPGGIVLVEKIKNVYDQDEYLETVIPVSN